ncbi:MAG: nuclease-related domain-containing protein [Elainellaceae cyanobacterium]
MARARRRAGHNVRSMAMRRRRKAIKIFVSTGLLFLPLIVVIVISAVSSQLSISLSLYLLLLGFPVIVGFSWVPKGLYLWRRANQADQGAAGEEAIEALLDPLKREGWKIAYGIRHRAVGDVDVFLISPIGKAFTIDVKSHRGYISTDGKRLYRMRGGHRRSFEKDFIAQAKRQAIAIQTDRKLTFVTPAIVFSSAKARIHSNPINKVYVLDKNNVLAELKRLGEAPKLDHSQNPKSPQRPNLRPKRSLPKSPPRPSRSPKSH